MSAPVERHLDAYRAAVLAKDVDAFVALYDIDVSLFDLWGAWRHDGLDAWRGMVKGWFDSLADDERVVVTFDDVRTHGDGDLVVIHAYVRYQSTAPDGTAIRAMDNRLTWTLARVDDAWKVVHEHTSAPVDFETMKVKLAR